MGYLHFFEDGEALWLDQSNFGKLIAFPRLEAVLKFFRQHIRNRKDGVNDPFRLLTTACDLHFHALLDRKEIPSGQVSEDIGFVDIDFQDRITGAETAPTAGIRALTVPDAGARTMPSP